MSDQSIPQHFHLEYSAEAIATRTRALGQEIGSWATQIWQESHTDIVAIPILRGALFFCADLLRAIEHSVEVVPTKTIAYDEVAKSLRSGEVSMSLDDIPVLGRVVLLIDDICDSGKTLSNVSTALLARGAREVRSVVAVHRLLHDQLHKPNWSAFQYSGDEWFVGYGMEDSQRWRNLPGIYTIRG